MGWFIPVVAFAGRTLLRRPILSATGAIIAWEFYDADGTPVGRFVEGELNDALSSLAAAGGTAALDITEEVVGGLGEAIPEIIERLGPSVIKGVTNTVAAFREELRGSEMRVLTTFMIFLLAWTTGVYILSWVRGAGERAALGGV